MDLASIFARIGALPLAARVAGISGTALLVVISFAFAFLAHPQRSTLFATPLHPDQLADVEERLASWNVAFTPAADNVLVDGAQRNDLLLRLSMADVPRQHIDTSTDALGKLSALTPQAVIDAQTRNALAGDIELGLRGIDGVQDARVIVAPAKTGYFADESSRDATASVKLHLLPGSRLSPDAVDGIRTFVAASVPGLDPRNVTIVDDRGLALGAAQTADEATDLQRSLQSALDSAIGAGAAIVRVHVEYDRRTLNTREVRRAPVSETPIASTTQDERYFGDGKRYDRSDRQLDRGSDTREIDASSQTPRIARLSAAVFLDASRGIDAVEVRSLAEATLGIDRRRGDTLDVAAVSFAHALTSKKDVWWLAYGAIVPLLPTAVIAIAALLAFRWASAPAGTLVKALVERSTVKHTTAAVSGIAPAGVRGALANEPPHAAAAIISALPAATAAAVLEMYPEDERAAIVRRMQRPVTPLLSDPESLIARA